MENTNTEFANSESEKKLNEINDERNLQEDLEIELDFIIFQIFKYFITKDYVVAPSETNNPMNEVENYDRNILENKINFYIKEENTNENNFMIHHNSLNENSKIRKNKLHIIKIVSEKLSININKFLDQIFNVEDYKKLQDVYEQNFHDTINHSVVKHNTKYCCKCHQKFCCKENKKENDAKLEVLVDFFPIINNFKNFYIAITESSIDFEYIFEKPLNYITKDNQRASIKFLTLIKEEFIKSLFASKWLKHAITRVYNAFKFDKKNHIMELIAFLHEIQMIIPSQMNKLKFLINEDITKDKFESVDDLLSYINENNNNKIIKKRSKKNSKGKKEVLHLDEIVEEFKRLLMIDSIHKNSIKKIVPNLTQDWINNIKLC